MWSLEYKTEVREQYFIEKSWDITNNFSYEELVGQLFHVSIPGKVFNGKTKKFLDKIKPGGVLLFGRNLGSRNEILSLTNSLQKNSNLALFISTDQEGGRVKRVLDGLTQLPGAMAVGQTNNSDYAYKVGFITSYELKQLGINLLFAPILDINNNPRNPVIGTRSFGSNLENVLNTAIFYEKGARLGGAIPVIKHFPGHGDTNIDSHLGLPVIDKSLKQLENFELVPFKKSVESGAKAVMSAHILYPKIDKDYPATLSKKILQEILRENMNFKGMIITDDLEMDAIDKYYKEEKQAVLAVLAGANILLLSSWGQNALNLKSQLEDFFLEDNNIAILKKRVQNQILMKIKAGLFKDDLIFEDYREFFLKKKSKADDYYQSLNPLKLNKEITNNSIRSYPNSHTFVKKKNFFVLKNSQILNFLKKSNIAFYNNINSISKFEKNSRVIFEVSSNKEIDLYTNFAVENKEIEVVLINFKNPFLYYPKLPNLVVLLSFSDTLLSKKSLIEVILQNRTTPKANLNML